MKRAASISGDGPRVEFHYHAAYSQASLVAGQHPVYAVHFDPGSRSPTRLRFRIPEIHYELGGTAAGVQRKLSFPAVHLAIELLLKSTVERIPAHLELMIDGQNLDRVPISILSPWDWSHAPEARVVIAACVVPGDETVARVVTEASRRSGTLSAVAGHAGDGDVGGLLEILYDHLAEDCSLVYEKPRVEVDSWCGMSHQHVRPPGEIFPHGNGLQGRGNCLDLSLLLAGCLESLGLNPVVLFSGTGEDAVEHAFVGCRRRGQRFHPLRLDGAELRNEVESGELHVLEATGVTRGPHRLGFEAACRKGQALLRESSVHAVDITACRPPVGTVRSLTMANHPLVQRAIWHGQELAVTLGSRHHESLHLLYGLCAAEGEITDWLLTQGGTSNGDVRALLEQLLSREVEAGSPRPTRNYDLCLAAARRNAQSEGRSTVMEPDLLWAVIESPSKGIRRALESAGCDVVSLATILDQRWKRPGEMSMSRPIAGDGGG